MKKNVIIIGATGFGGLGLIEILLRHPNFKIKQLIARKDTGKDINDIFPSLKGFISMPVQDMSEIIYEDIDLVFFSTPDRAGMSIIREFTSRDIKVIDYSGDFRFNSSDDYSIYAQNKSIDTVHLAPELLKNSVYGLIEKNREQIKNAKIIGNPGCFAISMILGILPAVENGIVTDDKIICDGKSGVSGAGKNPGEANFYPQRHENVNTYREGRHQHLVEVENVINKHSVKKHQIFFIPQVVPMTRGILSTIYFSCPEGMNQKKLTGIYKKYYENEKFVMITDHSPGTCEVKGSNFCKIRPAWDERTRTAVIISVIDNLMKGQSGNAVQTANIIFGFE
ncbi:MAG: N-acetyl-gamma-glutamyl-phosphate reductase, partial [Spirochaetes bacterium]|nr:N-acetyl-gamma-glutamyl-phosphate reductase [Spirochaetota bacterium]